MTTAGIDLSDFQAPSVAQQAWNWGARFEIIKASEGAGFKARSLGAHYDTGGMLGYKRGAYHFYDSRASWSLNLSNFLAATDGRTWEIPHALDYEEGSGRANPDDVLAFLVALERSIGRTPIIYGDHPWLASVLGGAGRFGRFPLWLAGYPNAYNHPQPQLPASVSITAPAPWTKATIWQFSDSGGSLDLNVCDDLAALLATPTPTPGGSDMAQADVDAINAHTDAQAKNLLTGVAMLVGAEQKELDAALAKATLIAQDADNAAHKAAGAQPPAKP